MSATTSAEVFPYKTKKRSITDLSSDIRITVKDGFIEFSYARTFNLNIICLPRKRSNFSGVADGSSPVYTYINQIV